MTFYENLVTETQFNYSNYYSTYRAGGTALKLSSSVTEQPKVPPEQTMRMNP